MLRIDSELFSKELKKDQYPTGFGLLTFFHLPSTKSFPSSGSPSKGFKLGGQVEGAFHSSWGWQVVQKSLIAPSMPNTWEGTVWDQKELLNDLII